MRRKRGKAKVNTAVAMSAGYLMVPVFASMRAELAEAKLRRIREILDEGVVEL